MKKYEEEILESLDNLSDISKGLKTMPNNTGELLVALAHKWFINYEPKEKTDEEKLEG